MTELLAVSEASAQARGQVLLSAAVDNAFDYLLPAGLAEGTLVEASLANKPRIGALWSHKPASDIASAKIKPITRVLDHLPPLKQTYRDWIDWMADFTLAPKGAVLGLCGLSFASKTPRKPFVQLPFTPKLPTLSPDQQRAADFIIERIRRVAEGEPRSGGGSASAQGGKGPPSIKPIVLDGVTGSGKTEVYSHAIAAALAQGKQVLVLLPEIALTHQWLARFEQNFGATPAVWHSHATPVARAKVWQAAARGTAPLVVGARSALFLPFSDLGLIIVDEEHDPSYKQEDGVLYHARDMAVVRARFEGIPLVLASATPSLETIENLQNNKYIELNLPARFGGATLPNIELVDLVNYPPERGEFISPIVKNEMLSALARGEQSLLFLNRRGYAPLLLCRGCGHRFQCRDCSAWLVVHGKNRLECHHCGHSERLPDACPNCQAPREKLAPCGPGVERIAEEVRAMFGLSEAAPASVRSPQGEPERSERGGLGGLVPPSRAAPKIVILSSDESIAAETWSAIERGEIDILVGTQMVAKGHHFPRLTFVGVIDADVGLAGGADLRAGERTYQLLHQLAGRAGREQLAGKVLVQSYQPSHPVLKALAKHDRDKLMRLESDARHEGGWPPYGQLAAILLDGVNEANVRRAGQLLAQSAPQDARLRILGPAPAPLSKLRGQYRYRLLVKAERGINLQATLKAWLTGRKFPGVRLKLDVNPYYFL